MTAVSSPRALALLLLAAITLTACHPSAAKLAPPRPTLTDPQGCALFEEGPMFITHPRAGSEPGKLQVILRTQFQTAEATGSAAGPAVSSDPHVVRQWGFRREPNGMAYTEFIAEGIGRATITVTRGKPGQTPIRLRLTVSVVCH